MPANYDTIAPVYDFISRMVFGNAIVNAQVSLLKCLPVGDYRLLIVGGGTGWILEDLAKQRPNGVTVDFVEASNEMIQLARKRNCGGNSVNFIHCPIENFKTPFSYQAILTPFVLDNFEEEKAKQVFNQLDKLLAKDGVWLYADFVYDKTNSPMWQKGLLKLMYFFFRLTTKIEANRLVNIDTYFEKGYSKKMEARFYFDFIKAIAYRKL